MINNKVTYLYTKEDNFDQKLNEFLRSRNISDIDIEVIKNIWKFGFEILNPL